MKIDFDRIIKNSGEKISKRNLAEEMYQAGVFKSVISGINMMNYHERGEAKSIDYELLGFLMERFDLTKDEIIIS
jgi:hypothetical protein